MKPRCSFLPEAFMLSYRAWNRKRKSFISFQQLRVMSNALMWSPHLLHMHSNQREMWARSEKRRAPFLHFISAMKPPCLVKSAEHIKSKNVFINEMLSDYQKQISDLQWARDVLIWKILNFGTALICPMVSWKMYLLFKEAQRTVLFK